MSMGDDLPKGEVGWSDGCDGCDARCAGEEGLADERAVFEGRLRPLGDAKGGVLMEQTMTDDY
jgi:hypothetical protein